MALISVSPCQRRSELVQKLFDEFNEDWHLGADTKFPFEIKANQDADFARDVEELCGECLDIPRLYQQAWQKLLDNLPEIKNTQEAGRAFQGALNDTIQVCGHILALCAAARKMGQAITGAEKLKGEILNLQELAGRVDRDWPFLNKKMMESSKDDFRRGAYRTAEDLLHDQESHCPANHQS